MILTWDFACETCGRQYPSYPYIGHRPEVIECLCGEHATWTRQTPNIIHGTLSTRKYGQFDPQLGCAVRDYVHKKQLLKAHGLEELPPETLQDVRENPAFAGTDRPVNSNVIRANSIEEIESQIDTDQIDHRLTGSSRSQPAQDYLPADYLTDSEDIINE